MFVHTVRPGGKAYWWKIRTRPSTVGLWLEEEWVNTRPAKGRVRLPAGTYRAAIQLAEESFHKSRPGWARVLQGPVLFETVPETGAAPGRNPTRTPSP